MRSRARQLSYEELEAPALVFSPHPDDETLGCAGTIIKKREEGARIKIVYMTDGSRSHRHLMSEARLRALRMREAVRANSILGIPEHDIIFLLFLDKELAGNFRQAEEKVFRIIQSSSISQVFIPYHRESPDDHFATNKIVLSALKRCNLSVTVYEYPIWFWNFLPWVKPNIGGRRDIPIAIFISIISSLQAIFDLNAFCYIGDVLELKRAALDKYESQMRALVPSERWLTLTDVSNGEFLQCFFQKQEFFHRYSFKPR